VIPLPDDITYDDVHQWLAEGVFLAKRPDTNEFGVAYLRRTRDEGVAILFSEDGLGATVPLADIRCHWPTCGAVNYNDQFALYVQRRQRRQWRRTYNSRCVEVQVPGRWHLLKQHGAAELAIDQHQWPFLKAVFDPEYPSMGEAVQMLHERASVAVTPHLILVGRPETAVYYRGSLAGRIAGGLFHPACTPMEEARIRKILGAA
jgi:hypothetical protein